MSKKIGIFGGSFDPVHYGHLIMAEQCREHAGLDQVIFVPASQSPLKSATPHASPRQRIEMLRLAIAGHESFSTDTTEIDRGGKSYTVDTLKHFHQSLPGHSLHFLMGSDALRYFDRWRDPQTIVKLAAPIILQRPGSDLDVGKLLRPFAAEDRWPLIESLQFESLQIDISSSDIRRRVAAGQSIRYLTPRAVEVFIQTHSVYYTQS